MKKTINNEKTQVYLNKIGDTLNKQRTHITKQNLEEFATCMTQYSGLLYTSETIEQMEGGNVNISIEKWIQVWQYFQNIDKIMSAYDAKEMLYIAKQEFLPQIEEEIMAHHLRKENK